MSDEPDVNGVFEVQGLPPAPGGGQWSIYKWPGDVNEWPNPWDWQLGLRYIMKLVCDGTDEYTYPLAGWTAQDIVGVANTLIHQRLQHRLGEIADTMTIYPVPPA